MSKIFINKLNQLLESGELLILIDNCLSNSEVAEKLGYPKNGKYIGIVKKFIADNDISSTHFTYTGNPLVPLISNICAKCGKEFKRLNSSRPQTTCSKSCALSYFRSGKDHPNWKTGISSYRKFALDYYDNKCCICGYNNVEALEVHHLDKDRYNNEIENLEVLCANCHTIRHRKLKCQF